MDTTDRSRKLSPAELDAAQLELYATLVNGPRAHQPGSASLVDARGCLEGPFNAFLLQPALGQALQALGATIRYGAGLPDRLREVAILVVAAHEAAEFERHVHEPIGRAAGLTDEELAGIRAGDHGTLDGPAAVVARAVQRMLSREELSDATFAELHALLGEAGVFELTTVVGYYALLALQLRVFRVGAPGQPGSN